MKRIKIMLTMIVLSLVLFCAAALAVPAEESRSVKTTADVPGVSGVTETIPESPDEAPAEELTDADETEPSPETRFIAMLNRNYSYNGAFDDVHALAAGAAVSLKGYSSDMDGYGICVNSSLAAGYLQSFYGVTVDPAELETGDAPTGYISVPALGIGTFYHTPVSVTEENGVYTVVTCMTTYFGGDDLDSCLVKSQFVKDDASAFGFHLVYAETL